jgi:hypothetical protein
MIDWFWSGIFGGIFAKPLAKLLRRFRLSIIFLAGCIGTHLGPFLADGWSHGWHPAAKRSIDMLMTPAGILVPLAIGALCVLLVLVCAPNHSGSNGRTKNSHSKDG